MTTDYLANRIPDPAGVSDVMPRRQKRHKSIQISLDETAGAVVSSPDPVL